MSLIKFAVPLLALSTPASLAAQHTHAPTQAHAETQIPESMRTEHEHIHHALEAATRAPGAVGEAARALAAVLGPHFERENQIALPPLGALPLLARGGIPGNADAILAMTDSLRTELPRMLEEHVHIDAAAKRLEAVAREHGADDVERMAHSLQLHARTEQEVSYPTALVVGDLIRARLGQHAR